MGERGGMGGGRGGMGGEGWDHEIKRRRIELEKLMVQWFLSLFPFPSLKAHSQTSSSPTNIHLLLSRGKSSIQTP